MNDLINTLLDCPNLSLRLLDSSTGRTLRTLSAEQLRQFAQAQAPACHKECDNMACGHRAEMEKLSGCSFYTRLRGAGRIWERRA